MSLDSLVEQITSDLNDDSTGYANIVWTKTQIREWLIEGMNLVFDKRPDLFMKKVILKVKSCSIIQDSCDCEDFRRVYGQVTEDGRLIKKLRESSLDLSLNWNAPACRTQNDFNLNSYSLDEGSRTLYLYPEIPAGIDRWVLVECTKRPSDDNFDDSEFPQAGVTATKQWALWRAKSMDMEISTAAMSAAAAHYRAFFDVLGLAVETTAIIHKKDK